MKKLFTLVILSLFVFCTKANTGRSVLKLSIYDNSSFCVVIDGQRYNLHQSWYNFPNLSPGNHQVKIIKHGYNSHYNKHYKGNYIFSGYIFVPGATEITAMLDRYNRLRIIEKRPLYSNYGINHHNSRDHYNSERLMTYREFEQLKNTMYATSFDNTRLMIAKRAIRLNRVTSRQILELLETLTFESNRLQLAKFAYAYTVDKERYFIVFSALTILRN